MWNAVLFHLKIQQTSTFFRIAVKTLLITSVGNAVTSYACIPRSQMKSIYLAYYLDLLFTLYWRIQMNQWVSVIYNLLHPVSSVCFWALCFCPPHSMLLLRLLSKDKCMSHERYNQILNNIHRFYIISKGLWVTILVALDRPDLVRSFIGFSADPNFTEYLLWKNLPEQEKEAIMRDSVSPFRWHLLTASRCMIHLIFWFA
jgi:hypothetical protein